MKWNSKGRFKHGEFLIFILTSEHYLPISFATDHKTKIHCFCLSFSLLFKFNFKLKKIAHRIRKVVAV